jgi:hypothetical protein
MDEQNIHVVIDRPPPTMIGNVQKWGVYLILVLVAFSQAVTYGWVTLGPNVICLVLWHFLVLENRALYMCRVITRGMLSYIAKGGKDEDNKSDT